MARILFVNHSDWLRKDVQDFYSNKGHTVLAAHDCRTGLELALASCPSIVLTPKSAGEGMDGYELAQAIRANEAARGAYLIAMGIFLPREIFIFNDRVSIGYIKHAYQLDCAVNRGLAIKKR